MKLQSLLNARGTLAAVFIGVLAMGLLAVRANASKWDQQTILNVTQPIQVRDTVLEPGQYILRLYDSQSDRHIVEILNSDQSRILDTVIAIPIQHLEPTNSSEFTFWETPPGTARAMRNWFYPGETIGEEFPYPAHLKQLTVAAAPAPAPAPAPQPQPRPSTASTAPAQPENHEANRVIEEQQSVVVAQNTPPAQAPQPAPAPAPTELPKTASPYPLFGLLGFAMLVVADLLKLKQSA